MPQQLIYTSAPRGLVAGRSGYCTVVRSATMREALMLRLEQFSYYDHVSLAGGTERPVFACRVIDVRGTRYHVLSRIQDAGLDFTGRTNFIAHHLVVTPEEVLQMPTPAMVFRKWAGWVGTWNGEPGMLTAEDWSGLTGLCAATCLPARTWAMLAGDPVHAYGLLEARPGTCFCPGNATDDTLLTLLAESTELLDVRDSRRDFHVAAWERTFTTSWQDQDNPADFRWRFVRRDHPAFARQAGSGCISLPSVRAANFTDEEKLLAQKGRLPAKSVSVHPQAHPPIQEGEKACFQAEADGVPYPQYQWYEIEIGTRQPKPIKGATNSRLEVQPRRGVARYKVEAFNRANGDQRACAEVSIEVRAAYKSRRDLAPQPTVPAKRRASLVSVDDDGESLRRKQRNVEKAEEIGRKLRQEQEHARTVKWAFGSTALLACLVVLLVAWKQNWFVKPKAPDSPNTVPTNQAPPDPTSQIQSPAETNAPAEGSLSVTTGLTRVGTSPTNAQSVLAAAPTTNNTPDAANTTATEKSTPPAPPWQAIPIGPQQDIEVRFTNSCYLIKGGGTALSGQYDSFSFVCQSVSSDGVFEARFVGAETLGNRFGIMMRESDKPEAPFVFVGFSRTNSQNYHLASSRQKQSEPVGEHDSQPWNAKVFKYQLSRVGNRITASYMSDGQWKSLTEVKTEMASTNYLVGLVVCPGVHDKTLAKFDEVKWNLTSAAGSPANRGGGN
jgi:hypothetical protein